MSKPSIITKSKNAAIAATKVAKKLIIGGRIKTTDMEYDHRMAVCSGNICGNYDELNVSCMDCGCYLKQKLSLTTEKCPLGFWNSIGD